MVWLGKQRSYVIVCFVAVLFLPLYLLGQGGARAQSPDQRPDFAISNLEIITQDGARHSFKVEIADTETKRGFGLMFVQDMADDQGMLFDYRRDQSVSMWMKNTYISLDMVFIESDGEIESLITRARPHDLTPLSSKGRVRAVLELKGGTVSRLGIKPGDQVMHPLFNP